MTLAEGKATQKLISMIVKRCAVLSLSNQQAENRIQYAGPSIVSSLATSAVVPPLPPSLLNCSPAPQKKIRLFFFTLNVKGKSCERGLREKGKYQRWCGG